MSSPPDPGARPRTILVIANETCASAGIVEEVRYRAGPGARVVVVAPALASSRLQHWLSSDMERRRAEASARLDASIGAFVEAGLVAEGRLGDGDPLQALDDALRVEDPDEVVISTHPHQRSMWLERQVVRRARERYDLPITHVVVDLEHESAAVAGGAADADAGRRTRPSEGGRRLRVFHASGYDEAMAIQSGGFRDQAGPGDAAGVWVSDRPPAEAAGDDWVVFALDLPEDSVAPFERAGGDEGRRFLLPAELLNRHGPPVAEGQWSE